MPQFRWSAVDGGGQVAHGLMEAPDQATVVGRLQGQGRIVLRADPIERNSAWLRLLDNIEIRRARGIDKTALAEVTRELAIMLGAGQDLDRALRFVADNTRNAHSRKILAAIRDKVRAGSSLAAALASERASFPQLYIGLVRAGETGGTLPQTLERIGLLLERERSLVASLHTALIYPALLVAAAIGSLVLLLEYVLPQFVPIFTDAGVQPPFAMRALMAIGTELAAWGPSLLLAALAGGMILRRLLVQPVYHERLDRLLLRLPVIGRLLRETVAARLTRTLGSLLQNGVPLIAALGMTAEALGNRAAAAAVDTAAGTAKTGAGLTRSLAQSGLFPARMIHLLQLGEEAARLPEMALKAAEIHEEEARLRIQRLVALAVPMITIAMGFAVAGIVGSLLTAMLSLNNLAT